MLAYCEKKIFLRKAIYALFDQHSILSNVNRLKALGKFIMLGYVGNDTSHGKSCPTHLLEVMQMRKKPNR